MTTNGCGMAALPGAPAAAVAPFVAKTYRMVDDPSTDAVVAWGGADNSIVVADPFALAQTLLPAYFKHRKFSSFVRQLNTYGFRKVHPDRWEFAHASFLRGKTQLLHRVVRRRSRRRDDGSGPGPGNADEDTAAARVATEVVRLRREHKANQERVAAMWRRVQETERRPRRMLAFLLKAAGDPQVARRLLEGAGRCGDGFGAELGDDSEAANRARMILGTLVDGSAGSQAQGFDGGGADGDDFDFTGFLTGGDGDDAIACGGGEGGYPMPPDTFPAPADGGY